MKLDTDDIVALVAVLLISGALFFGLVFGSVVGCTTDTDCGCTIDCLSP